jgi:hypothetical protein
MVWYRLCFINPNTGHTDRERGIEADDDIDAIHIAEQSDHRPLELWCESRKVRIFGSEAATLHA